MPSIDPATGFRDPKRLKGLAKRISEEAKDIGKLKIMHVCGSHEHTTIYWGLRSLLPENIELVAGPGCPVCVCSTHEIEEAIELAKRGVILATFGDMLRDKTKNGSLYDARARGGDIRVVYSGFDAVKLARGNPKREVVFFSVGFETTAAPTASLFGLPLPPNFSILTSHKLTSPAVELLLQTEENILDALIAPGHVSTIVGAQDWARFPEKYNVTTVVAGFEPLDVLIAILEIVRRFKEGRAELVNEYRRLVKYEGNLKAREWIDKVFEVKGVWWRGIGVVPNSGLFLRSEYEDYDARKRFELNIPFDPEADTPPGCVCHLVILGKKYPPECPLFGKSCTPGDPYGPCMVSEEGTCYIWHRYGNPEIIRKFKKREKGSKI